MDPRLATVLLLTTLIHAPWSGSDAFQGVADRVNTGTPGAESNNYIQDEGEYKIFKIADDRSVLSGQDVVTILDHTEVINKPNAMVILVGESFKEGQVRKIGNMETRSTCQLTSNPAPKEFFTKIREVIKNGDHGSSYFPNSYPYKLGFPITGQKFTKYFYHEEKVWKCKTEDANEEFWRVEHNIESRTVCCTQNVVKEVRPMSRVTAVKFAHQRENLAKIREVKYLEEKNWQPEHAPARKYKEVVYEGKVLLQGSPNDQEGQPN